MLLLANLHFLAGLIIWNVLTNCGIIAYADVKGSIIKEFTMFARVVHRAAVALEIAAIVNQ